MVQTVNGLLVIGDVACDVVATHETPARDHTDTAAKIELRPGGSGANAAAWAAHNGAHTTLLARVGDIDADWHSTALRRDGVIPVLRRDAELGSAVVLALIDSTGERTMVTDRGAGAQISPSDWDESLLDGIAHLHISGYALFTTGGRELARAALDAAAARGITSSVDPSSTGFLHDHGVDTFFTACEGAGLILPNHAEATLLTGTDEPARAARRLSRDFGIAVVTLGAQGAIAAEDGTIVDYIPAPEARVTDSIGAGDAFTGAFLAAMLAGEGSAQAAAAGCRAGARAVTVTGGRPPH